MNSSDYKIDNLVNSVFIIRLGIKSLFFIERKEFGMVKYLHYNFIKSVISCDIIFQIKFAMSMQKVWNWLIMISFYGYLK